MRKNPLNGLGFGLHHFRKCDSQHFRGELCGAWIGRTSLRCVSLSGRVSRLSLQVFDSLKTENREREIAAAQKFRVVQILCADVVFYPLAGEIHDLFGIGRTGASLEARRHLGDFGDEACVFQPVFDETWIGSQLQKLLFACAVIFGVVLEPV